MLWYRELSVQWGRKEPRLKVIARIYTEHWQHSGLIYNCGLSGEFFGFAAMEMIHCLAYKWSQSKWPDKGLISGKIFQKMTKALCLYMFMFSLIGSFHQWYMLRIQTWALNKKAQEMFVLYCSFKELAGGWNYKYIITELSITQHWQSLCSLKTQGCLNSRTLLNHMRYNLGRKISHTGTDSHTNISVHSMSCVFCA